MRSKSPAYTGIIALAVSAWMIAPLSAQGIRDDQHMAAFPI